MNRNIIERILADQDGHLASIKGASLSGAHAEVMMSAVLAKALTFMRIRPDEFPDRLEFIQIALDDILRCLACIVDRTNRADPLTRIYLALAYARHGITDLVHHGKEPSLFTKWPRAWQAMLSNETRDEHGHGVHGGYCVNLLPIRGAEAILKEIKSGAPSNCSVIATGTLSLLKRFKIPYREYAWRAREHELYLSRCAENPTELEWLDSSIVD
ncbi:hypothetical protein [Sphingomonas sp. LHG3406-1]|uniref:hypothetical protein n=1 Tax=Sphingomonas sp. LHG3406-1 TaxID=2804617 RepID=UPI0026202A33|nr:hypothetical protein [Sphingomonas sp. LHG3406-1]